jgi:hypothetical protein
VEDILFGFVLKYRPSLLERDKRVRPEGAAHNPIATVNFEHNGEKKIMLNYAKLRIVE